MRQAIPFVTGIITIIAMLLAGNKDWRGWALGLANQVPWFASIVAFGMWGLLPLNVFMVAVYVRNLVKWRREQRLQSLVNTVDWDQFVAGDHYFGAPVIINEHVPKDTFIILDPSMLKVPDDFYAATTPGVFEQLKDMAP